MLDFDTMLTHVGEFGLYQKLLFTFQAPFCMFVTFVLFGQLFMAMIPIQYWCEDHFACIAENSNITPAQRRNISFQWRSGGIFANDPCRLNLLDADVLLRSLQRAEEQNCQTNPNEPCDCVPERTGRVTCERARQDRPQQGGSQRGREKTTPLPPPPRLRLEDEYVTDDDVVQRRKKRYRSNYRGPTTQDPYSAEDKEWESAGGHNNYYEPTTTDNSYYKPGYGGGGGRDRFGNTERYTPNYGPASTPRSGARPPFGGGSTRKPVDSGQGSSTASASSGGANVQNAEICWKDNGTRRSGWRSTWRSEPNPNPNPATPNAFLGWPTPKCEDAKSKQPKERFLVRLGANTTINASRMINEFESCANSSSCSKIRWNRREMPYETVVTEGNWWCHAELYTTIAQSVFFLGAIVGGFLIGWIADTFGRVPALVIANVLGALGGALSVVSTNIYVFSAMRFITGMAFDNCFTMMYILVLEFCGPSYRTLVANLSIAVFYTLGTILLPVLAVTIANWKIYTLVISLPMLLALLALFFVPESARWLLSKGRAKEATNILRNFAKVNRRKVDEHIFTDFEQEATKLFAQLELEEPEPGLGAAFKTPRLRRTFILLTMIWALIALVYDGHSRNIMNLANEDLNVFWLFGIASMTEFPADMLLIFTLDRFGRRWLAFGAMTLSGSFSFISAALVGNRAWFMAMAIISRFWVNVAFNIGLQYAAELLPTVIRAQGVNAIHIMGYVASIISPFVAAIGRTNPSLSLFLLGGFSIAAGLLSLFLAETLGEELPNTLEEAEEFGKNQSFWNCPICAKEREDEFPIQPAAVEERSVILRNALRGSIRGETYRSSMISHGSGRTSDGVRLQPGGSRYVRNPEPATELTKLRRTTH